MNSLLCLLSVAPCHLPVGIKASSRCFLVIDYSAPGLCLYFTMRICILGKSLNREQQKQDFRIFNVVVRNRMDCQSREIRRKDISWEVILLLQAEGNESVNSGNDGRDGGRTLRRKTPRT